MADFNPNQVLPGKNAEVISVNTLTKHLNEAREQAANLAKKANGIWRKMNPDDTIKTNVYDMKDFLDGNKVVIPPEVEKLFEEFEEKRISDREKKDEENAKKENETQPSSEDLKKLVTSESIENSSLKINQVKRNPVFDKLMNSFGLHQDTHPNTVKTTINGLDITIEYPSSMITNFALAYASSEGIGSLDFGYNLQLMTLALSVVEIDGSPISTALNITDAYSSYYDIPTRVRKVCGVKMLEFFQAISDKELEKFMTFYEESIGFNKDIAEYNPEEFVEVKCPNCGRTELLPVTSNGIATRYCRDDGTLMEVQSSNKTDENSPLA